MSTKTRVKIRLAIIDQFRAWTFLKKLYYNVFKLAFWLVVTSLDLRKWANKKLTVTSCTYLYRVVRGQLPSGREDDLKGWRPHSPRQDTF